METLSFATAEPLLEVPRALDLLRKMGFELGGLIVLPSRSGFTVELEFKVVGTLTANTFIERLRHCNVSDIRDASSASVLPIGGRDGQNHVLSVAYERRA